MTSPNYAASMDAGLREDEKKVAPVERDAETFDLFAPRKAEDVAFDLERTRERLKTLAGELALKAGAHGVTVSDLRIAAVNRGTLTGEEKEERIKQLNLGAVMAKAGLFATSTYRRSDVAKAHGNLNTVWVTEEHANRRAS